MSDTPFYVVSLGSLLFVMALPWVIFYDLPRQPARPKHHVFFAKSAQYALMYAGGASMMWWLVITAASAIAYYDAGFRWFSPVSIMMPLPVAIMLVIYTAAAIVIARRRSIRAAAVTA